MALTSETRIGPYEIVSPLGAGGMGEVYRAHDPRLGRQVAIKVLPASYSQDADRLRRFEQEARAAAALNHPNILAIFDIGALDGSPYIVSELLEGQTLRDLLRGGPLSQRKTVDYSIQIARGLATAHDKGIVHRDLKPENIFITEDGRVKILDFGLAKLTQPDQAPAASATLTADTDAGTVVGTMGYMSPEQVRGQAVDHRSDIFAMGAILYEMLSGKRAFHGATGADIMSAILKEDPPELSETNRQVSPALERIVRHCLEKSPAERFQSMRDVAFDLESLSVSSSKLQLEPAPASHRRAWIAAVAAVLLLAAIAGAVFAGRGRFQASAPTFHRLTFRRGSIRSARFAPDGQTIVYSAAWDGNPVELFTARYGGSDSRPMAVGRALVLGVSSTGEMALLMNPVSSGFLQTGTLARMPLNGGAARELMENVQFADWSPDGSSMAVVRLSGQTVSPTSFAATISSVEYPVGKEIYRGSAWIGQLRISPDNRFLAFIDHVPGGDDGWIVIVDRNGKQRLRSQMFASVQGLAWAPNGGELWFAAAPTGGARALYAVNLAGKQRLVLRVPGTVTLHDIAANGRVLLTTDNSRQQTYGLAAGESKQRNIAWFDWSLVNALSNDGKTVLIGESGEGVTSSKLFLRALDGSPAVSIADAGWGDLSPDKTSVIATDLGNPAQLGIWPTGAGTPRTVTHDQLSHGRPVFMPDGKAFVFIGRLPNSPGRMYFQTLQGGAASPITPEGVVGTILSPDGRYLAAPSSSRGYSLYPVHGGTPRPVPGTEPLDLVVGWSADGNSLFLRKRGELPIRIYRLNIATGKRDLLRETSPPDAAGVEDVVVMKVTPDGRSYAYSCFTVVSDLYAVDDLR